MKNFEILDDIMEVEGIPNRENAVLPGGEKEFIDEILGISDINHKSHGILKRFFGGGGSGSSDNTAQEGKQGQEIIGYTWRGDPIKRRMPHPDPDVERKIQFEEDNVRELNRLQKAFIDARNNVDYYKEQIRRGVRLSREEVEDYSKQVTDMTTLSFSIAAESIEVNRRQTEFYKNNP